MSREEKVSSKVTKHSFIGTFAAGTVALALVAGVMFFNNARKSPFKDDVSPRIVTFGAGWQPTPQEMDIVVLINGELRADEQRRPSSPYQRAFPAKKGDQVQMKIRRSDMQPHTAIFCAITAMVDKARQIVDQQGVAPSRVDEWLTCEGTIL